MLYFFLELFIVFFFFLTYGSLEFCGRGLELGFWCWGLWPVALGFLGFLGDVALFINIEYEPRE